MRATRGSAVTLELRAGSATPRLSGRRSSSGSSSLAREGSESNEDGWSTRELTLMHDGSSTALDPTVSATAEAQWQQFVLTLKSLVPVRAAVSGSASSSGSVAADAARARLLRSFADFDEDVVLAVLEACGDARVAEGQLLEMMTPLKECDVCLCEPVSTRFDCECQPRSNPRPHGSQLCCPVRVQALRRISCTPAR